MTMNLDVQIAPLTHDELKALLKDKPIPVKRDDLEVILQNCRRGARPVTIVATTTPKVNVKDKDGHPMPPKWRTGAGKSAVWHIRKRATVNGFIQFSYEAAVNAQREREGLPQDFKAELPSFGEARDVEGKNYTCLQDWTPESGPNAGKATVYLYIMVRRSLGYEYFLTRPEGRARAGVTLDPASVHSFMSERGDSRQGTETEIIVRKYTLANVERVVVDGKTYIVEGTTAYDEWQTSLAAA